MKTFIFLIGAFLLITCSTQTEQNDNQQSSDLVNDMVKEVLDASQEKTQTMIDGSKALSKAISSLLKIAKSTSPLGNALGAAVEIVFFFVDQANKKSTDLWKQIEDKVEIKIGQRISKYHEDRLYAEVFYVLENRIKKGKDFNANDLQTIMDKKKMVFPQYYGSLGFQYNLPLPILLWMPFMIAGYQKMIEDGNQPKCSLANELANVRAEIITACKEMLRKRYREVHGTKYSIDRVNYPCSGRRRRSFEDRQREKRGFLGVGGSSRRRKECVSLDRLMTYADGLSGHSFTVRKRNTYFVGSASWNAGIAKIRDDTVNFLWKELIEKANNFFDPKICLVDDGCKCPNKITKQEITFDWPKSCFGDSQCMHPADRFGYDYTWCYIPRNPDRWIKCNSVDWDVCMPVYTPKVTPPNVLSR